MFSEGKVKMNERIPNFGFEMADGEGGRVEGETVNSPQLLKQLFRYLFLLGI